MSFVKRLLGRGGSEREMDRWRTAGDSAEALAHDFDRAAPMLRVVLLPRQAVPHGDVHRPSFHPDVVEVLALDAGPSVRYVSYALAGSWPLALDEVWAIAEQRSLEQPFGIESREHAGGRALGFELRDGTPCISPFLTHLERVVPQAIGPLGTLVGIPQGAACFLLALDAYPTLSSDVVDVAYLTWHVATQPGKNRLFRAPFWRMPSGRLVPVSLHIADDGRLIGANDPAFAGVLTALSPQGLLDLPDWADPLDADSYTQLAGLISAATSIAPDAVARAAGLPLAELLAAWRSKPDLRSRFDAVLATVERNVVVPVAGSVGLSNPALDPANEARLVSALTEPGLSSDEARRLVSVIRRELQALEDADAVTGQLGFRPLVDLAAECQSQPEARWPAIARRTFTEIAAGIEELRVLEAADYDAVRPRLWPFLYPHPPKQILGFKMLEEEPLPGLFAQVAFYSSGARSRLVRADHLERWGVEADDVWADAAANLVAAPAKIEPWPDPSSPVRMVRAGDRDSEWTGLLLHRRPDACGYGYVVALPFRGSALYLPLDSEVALSGVPVFARLAADAFRRASQFDDHLYAKLLWLQPDGSVEVLCDLFDPPSRPDQLPPAFLQAVAAAHISDKPDVPV
jgi:hypothetical protein